jgi:signal recognition particle GTPase
MEKRYGRSGQYTVEEWQGVINMKRHEAQVSKRFQPQKDAIMAQVEHKLITAGVATEKVTTLAKMLASDRLGRVQWSSAAMKQAVMAIKSWYEEQIGVLALDQIEANNEIHVWGE